MSDYTREDLDQDTEFARYRWEAQTGEFESFDRWLAEVERAAAARALEEAADQWRYHWGSNGEETELWLRARAAEIRGQHGND